VNVYPDTSFYLAVSYRDDAHHIAATRFLERHSGESLLWSPWHRVEVTNAIRQMARGQRPALQLTDARRIIHALENDVRVGYFLHMEADWRDVLRSAYEISAAHGFSLFCRSADLLHVAYAQEFAAELFITFDRHQLEVARAVGLNAQCPG
jgi:predicted nucleic acid-binding protein